MPVTRPDDRRAPMRVERRSPVVQAAGARAAQPMAVNGTPPPEESLVPARARLVLVSLIAVAAVANLNLAVANVALPDIGRAFDSSQAALDLVAVGYSLGLAASVLWFGALGDRYGRKAVLVTGVLLSVPACLLAAYAPNEAVLAGARVLGDWRRGWPFPRRWP